MQPAEELRETAEEGWRSKNNVVFFLFLQWLNKLSIIVKYKIVLCTVRIIITYCVSFLAAKDKRNTFGIKARSCKKH